MIATFRETWASVRNLNYGQEIVKRTVGQAFWYWLKYVLLISAIIVVAAAATLTYFVPQTPRLAEKYLPEVAVTIKDGVLTTTAQQPLILSGEGFTFILNPNGQPEDIDQVDAGILVLKDRLVFKDQTQTKSIKLAEFKDEVKLDKPGLIGWLEANKLTLLSAGLIAVVFAAGVGIGVYTVWHLVALGIGGGALWVVARLLKRTLAFADSLKLAIYAAVPALLVSTSFVLNPNQSGSMVSLIVWGFFACIWLVKLPQSK